MFDRYKDIVELFPDELKGEALPFFIWWLIEKVLLLEVDTPSDDEAHTIFLTMNDRGLSLNSAEMMKAYIIQQILESDRLDVNHQWQENINRIKNASSYDTSGVVSTEDVEFIHPPRLCAVFHDISIAWFFRLILHEIGQFSN